MFFTGNIADANFRPCEISRVRIFAMAKFASANLHYGEISRCEFSLRKNFGKTKFHQDNSEISFDSTKICESFDEISW